MAYKDPKDKAEWSKNKIKDDFEYREKRKKSRREFYRRNREVEIQKALDSHLKRKYGLSRQQYNQMLEDQNGVCAICQNEDSAGNSLSVDHNHETSEVRGLLCSKCNRGLGMFNDSTKLLANAIKYLEGKNNV